jgi:hypothetical protein
MRIVLRGLVALLLLLGGLAIVAWWILRPPSPLELPAQGLTLNGVTVIEPGKTRRSHAQLVVNDNRIAAISEAAPGASGRFGGAFVLPGLNDVHVHFPPPTLPGQTEFFAFLYLYHGVTGVRDAGDPDGTSTAPARDGVAEGHFPGPRILACGPFIDGNPPRWKYSIVVESPEDARAAAQSVAEAGFDCVKAYDGLDGKSLAALHAEAGSLGLPVIGHVPSRVPFEQARLDDAQHGIGIAPPLEEPVPFPWVLRAWLQLDDARRDAIAAASLEHRIAHTPTLVTTERLAAQADFASALRAPDAQLMPRFYRDVIWALDSPINSAGELAAKDFEMVRTAHRAQLRTVKHLFDAGVELHSGTDTLVAFLVPGAALHRELRLFVKAGLTPEQALAISTRTSARALGVPGLGELRVGAPAELAIFREDPTQDLAALDTLIGVVRDGRLYTRAMLDAQLERYQTHHAGALYEALVVPAVRSALASVRPD